MATTLFPLLYLLAFLVLLVLAFQMMQLGRSSTSSGLRTPSDRTGLRTTHPELLDGNGKITRDKLLVVHFSDLDKAEPSR